MIHYMNLYNKPFEMIKSGEKTIELRLYDEKRQGIIVGDKVVFQNIDTKEKIIVQVRNIYVFKTFDELYKSLPLDKCGYKKDDFPNPDDMDAYYSKEKQSKYGVVGIEVAILP